MISWMQKHKKWLVITIWISTIAFVGAGFVGWGSYDYGKKGGVVALVGDREVTVEEYQQEYSSLYEQYARMFGSMFNQEMADKLNLKDMAFKQVVQKNLILSYADELGLDVTDQDIAKQLVKYNAFLKDGKFDKETYKKVLAQNRTSITDFENGLKRGILLEKVQSLFDVKPSKNEVENLAKLFYLKDDIEYKILSLNTIKVTPKEEEIKTYWTKHKNSYLSQASYDLLVSKTPLIKINPSDEEISSYYKKFKLDFKKADGKIKTLEEAKENIIEALSKKATKTKALKKYLKYKKGEEKLTLKQNYTKVKLPFLPEDNKKIIDAKKGTLIKPFFFNNEYVTVKVENINEAKPLSFEEAFANVKKDYIQVLKAQKLEALAKEQLKTFKGTSVQGVTRESKNKIEGLNQQESSNFLNQLFSSTKKENMVNLGNKIVLFKVLNSEFGSYDESKKQILENSLKQMQDQELMTNLVNKLEKSYEIQSSIQIKE